MKELCVHYTYSVILSAVVGDRTLLVAIVVAVMLVLAVRVLLVRLVCADAQRRCEPTGCAHLAQCGVNAKLELSIRTKVCRAQR